MKKRNAGIKVHFNPKNMYGEPCCCQKGYDTKFVSSTIYCVICNLFKLRARFKCSSWCKKNGWDKTCSTCNQKGNYNLYDKWRVEEESRLKKESTNKETDWGSK